MFVAKLRITERVLGIALSKNRTAENAPYLAGGKESRPVFIPKGRLPKFLESIGEGIAIIKSTFPGNSFNRKILPIAGVQLLHAVLDALLIDKINESHTKVMRDAFRDLINWDANIF